MFSNPIEKELPLLPQGGKDRAEQGEKELPGFKHRLEFSALKICTFRPFRTTDHFARLLPFVDSLKRATHHEHELHSLGGM